MKKIIFFAATLMAFASSALANVNKTFVSGIQFTEGFEIARGEHSPDFTSFMGSRIYTALTYNAMIAITPNFVIHPALGINFRYSSQKDDDENTVGSIDDGDVFILASKDHEKVYSLGIILPVTARYYMGNSFFGELGFEFNFNIFEKFNLGIDVYDDAAEKIFEPKTLNFGFTGGLGATFDGFEFSLKYTHGLTDLYKEKTSYGIKFFNWSYSRITLNIGYWFGYN